MAGLRDNLKSFLSYSKGESKGVFLLLLLSFVFLLGSFSFHFIGNNKVVFQDGELALLDSLDNDLDKVSTEIDHCDSNRFRFDPNVISKEDLHCLGMSKRIASRIVHYRQHGGTFVVKSDLKKIYGFPEELYAEIENYIDLPEAKKQPKKNKWQKKEILTMDLNLADIAQLKKIKGIGATLALRIVRYREQLGGYLHVEQLAEVRGLEEKFGWLSRHFYIKKTALRRLNINSASLSELMRHPYIDYHEAQHILEFRNQQVIENKSALSESEIFTTEEFEKIDPYINYSE